LVKDRIGIKVDNNSQARITNFITIRKKCAEYAFGNAFDGIKGVETGPDGIFVYFDSR
jgi:hypothetical protein